MSNSFHVSQVSRGQAFAILGGAALMMTLAMGIRQNLGLFQAPASKELGIAISDFALAISVQQVAWGLSQPFAGIVADKHGTRGVALVGSLLFIAGVVLTATAQGALPIVLGAGVLIGVALACTTSGITANIAARVVQPTRRTLAFGIVSAAGSVGTMLTAPIAAYMLNHDGWRAGLWAFAILAVAMLPAAWIGSRADKLPNSVPADRDLSLTGALRRGAPPPRLCRDVDGLLRLRPAARVPHHPPADLSRPVRHGRLLQRAGADADRRLQHPELLAVRLAGRQVSQAPAAGRHLPGCAPPPWRCSSCSRRRRSSVVLFGAAMGVLWLGVIPLVNGLVVQIFGLRYLSTLTGIAFLSHQAGSFLGAWGGGYLFDLMGSYDLAWKIGVFIGLIAGTMQLLMNDRPTARMQSLQAAAA